MISSGAFMNAINLTRYQAKKKESVIQGGLAQQGKSYAKPTIEQ